MKISLRAHKTKTVSLKIQFTMQWINITALRAYYNVKKNAQL